MLSSYVPNFDEFMTKASVENHNKEFKYCYENPHGRRKEKKSSYELAFSILRKDIGKRNGICY